MIESRAEVSNDTHNDIIILIRIIPEYSLING